MELELTRFEFTEDFTLGHITLNGEHICYTLEDKDRDLHIGDGIAKIQRVKVHGKTAIPTGRYEIEITYSNRFKKKLPQLMRVPGFEGIRIHPGNTSADTEGCLLPGTGYRIGQLIESRIAFNKLFEVIKQADKERVYITIIKKPLNLV